MKRLAIILLLLAPLAAAAANRFSVTSGPWGNTARWSTVCGGAGGSSIPGAADDVFICIGTTITLDANRTVDSMTINSGGTLTLSTFQLSIDNTPAFTLIAGGTLNANTSTVRFFNPANTTLTAGTFTGANSFFNVTINPAPGGILRNYTFGGAVSIGGALFINVQSAGGAARTVNVNLGGATTVTGLTTIQANGNEIANLVTNNNAFTTGSMVIGTAGASTASFIAGSSVVTAGTVNIGGLGTFTAGSSQVTLNGAVGPILTRTGTFTRGTSTVTMSPTASVALTSGTFTGANAFYDLTVDMPGLTGTLGAAIDLTGAAGAGGDLTLTAGTLADGGNAITSIAGGARILSATANGALTLGTAAIATAFPTSFTTIALNAGSTVTYNSDVAQAISATPVYGNLVLAATAAVVKTPSAGLNIDGSLTIGANNTLNDGGFSHTLAGNFTNNGAFSATGTLTLDGGAAQTIGGTSTFNNLTIANTVGGVSLTSDQTVGTAGAGTLTLTSGTLAVAANRLTLNGLPIAGTSTNLSTTSSSNLTFGGNAGGVFLPSSVANLNDLTVDNVNGLTLNGSPALAGTLTLTNGTVFTGSNTVTASTSCMTPSVVRTTGHVSGNLRLAFPAGTPNCTFDVGDATNYTPLQLNFSSVTTPGELTATAATTPVTLDHPNTTAGSSGILSGTSVNRYWDLKNSAVAGTFTGTFNYVSGDNDSLGSEASYRIRRGSNCSGSGSTRTCHPWLPLTVSGTPTSTQAVASGVTIAVGATAEADFAIGLLDAAVNFMRERQFIYTRELY